MSAPPTILPVPDVVHAKVTPGVGLLPVKFNEVTKQLSSSVDPASAIGGVGSLKVKGPSAPTPAPDSVSIVSANTVTPGSLVSLKFNSSQTLSELEAKVFVGNTNVPDKNVFIFDIPSGSFGSRTGRFKSTNATPIAVLPRQAHRLLDPDAQQSADLLTTDTVR